MRVLNFVIDAAAAASTDNIALVNQILYIGSAATTKQPVCRFLNIRPESVKKKITVAETLQITEVTVTGTSNSQTYSLMVRSLNPITQDYDIQTYTIQTPATGAVTATTIADQFDAMIDADTNAKVTSNNVAGLITLTAITGYATFTVTAPLQGDGTVAVAYTGGGTAAGVYPFGLTPYYDLQRWGLVAGDYTGSTAGYTRYQFVADQQAAEVNTLTAQQPALVNIWINTDDAQSGALVTAADAIFAQAVYNRETVELTIG